MIVGTIPSLTIITLIRMAESTSFTTTYIFKLGSHQLIIYLSTDIPSLSPTPTLTLTLTLRIIGNST